MPVRLAIDVGGHLGDDTARLLRAGWRVVVVEANPQLATHLRTRFSEQVMSGDVTVIGSAVHRSSGQLTFYVSSSDELSSFAYDRATAWGASATAIDVQTQPLERIMAEYGKPDLLKVDIEGLDEVCLDALKNYHRPSYVSLELGWDATYVLGVLESLGYDAFKIIDQRGYRSVTALTLPFGAARQSEPDHTSGPLGEGSHGRWMSPREAYLTLGALVTRRARRQDPLWHDLHARLGRSARTS